jgi:hypothetical protein
MSAEQSNNPVPATGSPEDLRAEVARLEHEVLQLREAVATRTLLGTAIGMLAERYGCTSQQAWTLITRVSSNSNLKAREVARLVVALADGTLEPGDEAHVASIAPHLPGLGRRTPPSPRGASVQDERLEGWARPLDLDGGSVEIGGEP